MNNFWTWFKTVEPALAHRGVTFRKMFEYLDQVKGPVVIVETGCARQVDNWTGDGQSTVMFDRYINERKDGSTVTTVDISADSVNYCRSRVSNLTEVNQDDSVHFLSELVGRLGTAGKTINLLYLDSFDVDFDYWFPSAAHHLKEMATIMPAVGADTLVVVDDCPPSVDIIPKENTQEPAGVMNYRIGGKGRLVDELARAVGAELYFSYYQVGWTKFNKWKK